MIWTFGIFSTVFVLKKNQILFFRLRPSTREFRFCSSLKVSDWPDAFSVEWRSQSLVRLSDQLDRKVWIVLNEVHLWEMQQKFLQSILINISEAVKMICDVSCLHQHEGGGRRSMMGDRTKLLTHYHDDARTMYEVFQRGLHISGG